MCGQVSLKALINPVSISGTTEKGGLCAKAALENVPLQLSSVRSSVWPHSSVESQISLCFDLGPGP